MVTMITNTTDIITLTLLLITLITSITIGIMIFAKIVATITISVTIVRITVLVVAMPHLIFVRRSLRAWRHCLVIDARRFRVYLEVQGLALRG